MNILRIITCIFFSYFFAFTNIGFSQCETDTIPPICIAPPDIQMSPDSFSFYFFQLNLLESDSFKRFERFGVAESVDNCNSRVIALGFASPSSPFTCAPDSIYRTFIAIDESGNQSDTCRQLISIDKSIEKIIQLPNLYEPFQSFIPSDGYTRIGNGYFILAQNWPSTIIETDTFIDYWALNWCDPAPGPEGTYFLPVFDIDGDGRKGDAYTMRVANDSLYFERPNLRDSVVAFPNSGWRYTLNQAYEFTGNAFTDLNSNCEQEADENGLINFNITVRTFPSGGTFETRTDSLGNYSLTADIPFLDTLFEIGYTTDLNLGQTCGNSFRIIKPANTLTIQQDFAINLVQGGQEIAVDIGTARLRRCFTNRYYVNYFNYTTEEISDVNIELKLDPFLVYESSSIPVDEQWGNTFLFLIGTLQSGESRQFYIDVLLSCDAILGQTHCTEVVAYPKLTYMEPDALWSGAGIQVSADCEEDTVRFQILNVSDAPMLEETNFVVTEDVLMLRQGTFKLSSLESLTLSYPANGATYRLAADQVKFYPYESNPSVSIEGCGGINTTGLVNAFPQDDQALNISIDCQENIGSYDPNDKSATPSGWGVEHYLAENTDIEYKIRFQNTGTDTAFKVVIVDTLSSFLDAGTIVPGAASHPYTYQQFRDDSLDLDIIQFTFADILLPDSTTNLEGSNGFVKFKIAQQADLPNGTRLENKAAIFFDFNEPIITNTVFHTIGEPFGRILSNTNEPFFSNRKISVQPNPFNENALITIAGAPIKNGEIRLYNALGRAIDYQSFSGNQITLQRNNLPSGFYIYAISVDNQMIATGKIQMSQK